MRLIAVAGSVGAAAVRDEYEVVFDQVDRFHRFVFHVHDLFRDLFAVFFFDHNVFHVYAVFDFYAVRFEIFRKRQNHAFILIVFRETKGGKIGQAVDVVHVSAKIPLHFQRAGPALECEHRLPVQPEIRRPETFGQYVGNLLAFKVFFGRHEKFGKGNRGFFIEIEFFIRVRVFAAIHRGAAEGIIRIVLVQPIVFVENGDFGIFD